MRIHFGSKDELWNACLEEAVANSAPVITLVSRIASEQARPAAERMRAAIAEIAEFYVRHPDLRHFVGRHVSEPPERSARLTDRLLRPAYESLHDLIVEAAALGVVRTPHPALFFALLNSALSQPASFPILMDQLAPELDPVRARQALTDMVIDALVSDPDQPPAPSGAKT